MNGKVPPARPGTRDGPYSNPEGQFGGPLSPQNGNHAYSNSRQLNGPSTNTRIRDNFSLQSPTGAVVLEGYRSEIMNGFHETPRFNPMNPTRPQSSILLNVNDPIQVHLLVETALGDSSQYEVLSQEEVDDLKKQHQSLTQRIEQTRQNLAIQSKYRDAAVSMAKLYSPDKKDGKRRSGILHHKSDSVKEADIERLRSEEKCEELAAELWSLEKRLMGPQLRLLKHTAGILQMTHKGPKKTSKGQGPNQAGIPGSPESIYTYHNARNSMEQVSEENFFDERSLYRSADRLDVYGDQAGKESVVGSPPRSQAREQMQMIAKTEQKLENLNSRLRELIVKANPEQEQAFGRPPPASTNAQGKPTEGVDTLQSHLDYLEKSISTIDQEQNQVMSRQKESDAAMEELIEDMNNELHNVLVQYDPNHPEAPQHDGVNFDDHISYFQGSVKAIEEELGRGGQREGFQDNVSQMEAVLVGLWDIVQSGQQDIRKRKEERKTTRSQNGLPADEDDMSDDDDDTDPNEPFSIQAFSAKVQWLYSQATQLKDHKKVLQRQIKQQRELNSKSDATKDAEMMQKVQDLERVKSLLTRTEMDADNVRAQLSTVMEKLNESQQQERLRDQERAGSESTAVRAAQEELDLRNETISRLEQELQEIKDDHNIAGVEIQSQLSEAEAKITIVTAELSSAISAKTTAEESLREQEATVEAKEREMDDMNQNLARLQTEVTIARAELDGAYGTRAQRAAEVAANPAIQREIDDLNKSNTSLTAELASLRSASASGAGSKENDAKVTTLKKELEETIGEYEIMTKASIEWEKERERLEETIDKLRDQREGLETQLSDEKVRWLGMQSPGGDSAFPREGNTSTTVLKNEFKKMMRDTRAENAKALRAEQAERRRIEDELRALKKLQGPGKSSLSQSM